MEKESIYYRLGKNNLELLVNKFYDLVFSNEILIPLFSNSDKNSVKAKQILFLTQFLGGPALYSQVHGHPRLRARHMEHEITEDGAIEWLKCMNAAIDSLSVDEQLKKELFNCFPNTAFFMVNKKV